MYTAACLLLDKLGSLLQRNKEKIVNHMLSFPIFTGKIFAHFSIIYFCMVKQLRETFLIVTAFFIHVWGSISIF
jgi:hypothetical protein